MVSQQMVWKIQLISFYKVNCRRSFIYISNKKILFESNRIMASSKILMDNFIGTYIVIQLWQAINRANFRGIPWYFDRKTNN